MSSIGLLEPTVQPDAVILGPAGGRAVPPLPPSSQFCSTNSGLCRRDRSHWKKKKKQDLSIFRLHIMSLVATMKAATGSSEECSVFWQGLGLDLASATLKMAH